MLKLYLFGQFHLTFNEEPLDLLGRNKARALLAYLVLEHARPVARTTLAHLLWDGYSGDAARASLRVTLSELRRAIDPLPFLRASRQSVQWRIDSQPFWCDVLAWEGLIGRIKANELPITSLTPQELFPTEFLLGFEEIDSRAFSNWMQQRREHYRQQQAALRTLYRQQHQVNSQQPASLGLQNVTTTSSLLQPSPGSATLPASMTVPPPKRIMHNLSQPHRPLLGRATELAQLNAQLCDPAVRLITLTGAPGVGKTHLANALAQQIVEMPGITTPFVPSDGIYWIRALAGENAPALLVSQLYTTLHLPTTDLPSVQPLLEYLSNKKTLVVLDNLTTQAQVKELLVLLLQHAPALKLLITGQQPMELASEATVVLRGVSTTPALRGEWQSADAIQIFLQDLAPYLPGRVIDSEAAEEIGQICQRLEGMPLALALAATLWAHLPLGTLLPKLAELQAEQRTTQADVTLLEVLIDLWWSFLQPAERAVLFRLALFAAPFPERVGLEVGMSSQVLFQGLVDKGLVEQVAADNFMVADGCRQVVNGWRQADPALDRAAWRRFVSYYAHQVYQQPASASLHWEHLLPAWQWATAQQEVVLAAQLRPAVTTYLAASGQGAL